MRFLHKRCSALLAIALVLAQWGCARQVEVSNGKSTLFTNWSLIKKRNTTPKKLWKLAISTGNELQAQWQKQCPTDASCKEIKQRLRSADQAQLALVAFQQSTIKIPTIRYRAAKIEPNGNSHSKPERTAYCLSDGLKETTKQQLEEAIGSIQAMRSAKSTNGRLFLQMDRAVCKTFN